MKINLLIILALLSQVTGCATPLYTSFSKLNLGDDKSVVLENIGSPQHTERLDDQDQWTYRYYRDGKEYRKQFRFEESKLVFIGNEVLIMDPNQLQIEQELESISK